MSPMYDKLLLVEDNVAFTADAYSTDEVDFGIVDPNLGRSGNFGLHVVVTTTFAGLASGCIIWIIHGAASSPTTRHIGRFFSAAQLVAGKHYFIPGGHTLLRYARAWFDAVTEVASAGKLTMWFGPDENGAE